MRIRRATPEDEAAVAGLMEQLGAAVHGGVAARLKARFAQMLTLDRHALWVAEEEGQVLGLVTASVRPTLYHSGPSVLIDELVVDASARGQGVGRALIAGVVIWASEQGASEVEVSTAMDNQAAQAFYQQCGFKAQAVLLELELDERSGTRPLA